MSFAADLRQHYAETRARLWPVKKPVIVKALPPPAKASFPEHKSIRSAPLYACKIGPLQPTAIAILTLTQCRRPYIPPLDKIAIAVCEAFHMQLNDIRGPYRRKDIVRARHIYIYLARTLTEKSFPQIGIHCGRRDHSTVLHAYNKIRSNLAEYIADIDKVREHLGVMG